MSTPPTTSPAAGAANARGGPLAGLRIVEIAGIGPGPFAGQMLADMGADVVCVERAADVKPGARRLFCQRGKRSIALDLKHDHARDALWRLIDRADALIEGFRPGTMERLGFGPDAVAARNPRCVYGRVTGWGQDGPLAQAAGHDINYVALTGATSISCRPGERPVIPATFLGDMAGGAMFLLYGVVCALLEAQRSGRGQVVDAAMVDGVNAMAMLVHQARATGWWRDDPQSNFFLNGSPFYEVFECADGKAVTLGAIEPPFYAELLKRLGLDDIDPARQYRSEDWPATKQRIAARLREKPRDDWCQLLEGSDACFAPVLDFDEAARHPHHVARASFVEVDGQRQPAPAPRLSRTPACAPTAGIVIGEHTDAILAELGCDSAAIAALRAAKACA